MQGSAWCMVHMQMKERKGGKKTKNKERGCVMGEGKA